MAYDGFVWRMKAWNKKKEIGYPSGHAYCLYGKYCMANLTTCV